MVLALLISSASAAYVTVTEPYNSTLNQGGSIFLGKVGPGQTFYITVSAQTQNKTGYTFSRGWNKFIASNTPAGWIVQNSSLNGQSLSIKITPNPNAQNGTYSFNLTAINLGNYSHLGTLSFVALIQVTPNVFKLQVNPTNVSAGPGQPAHIEVTINNTGVSDSPFVIKMSGLPAWNQTESVIALHGTVGNFSYPVYENEPGVYHAQINVTSGSSPLVYKRSNVTLQIRASVFNDYKALGEGAITIPIIYEPIYAVMYIISQIISSIKQI